MWVPARRIRSSAMVVRFLRGVAAPVAAGMDVRQSRPSDERGAVGTVSSVRSLTTGGRRDRPPLFRQGCDRIGEPDVAEVVLAVLSDPAVR